MSMEKRNYKNELIHRSLKDKATRLMVDKIFIENVKKFKNFRDYYCIFICKCGIMGKKKPRDILGDKGKSGSGLFCPRCTEQNRNLKMNKINNIDNKILYDCLRWWLVKIGKKYTNRKKWSKEDILNICSIEYERNGMKALIPKNLDSLPGIGLYNTYIRQYKKDENYQEEFKLSVRGNQNQKTPGYPDIYICEHLGLVNERTGYLKNNFPCETDTFEEMCEIHIRPFLENYIKNINVNGFILTEHIFYNNNKCNIKGGLKKHKKGINELRQYFQLNKDNLESLRKDSEGYYERRNSRAEIVFDNFLVLYTDLTNENIKWEEPYPQDFVKKNDKKCLMDCKITIDDKIIIVEIWNFSPDNKKNIGNQKNRYEDYIKWRKIKEDYWNTKEEIIFIGIDNEKLYCNQCEFNAVIECKNILSPYINILDDPKQVDCNVFPKNDYNLMMDECRDYFIKNDNKLYDDLPNKILKIIRKTYGNITDGLNELRNILHTEISDNNWKEKYISTKSTEKLQKIKEKTKQTNNNKSPEELQKIREKQKQTMKENLHSKGINNPMFGKKDKDNPNYGSKQPRHTKEEYKTMYAPLICKFLQTLDEGDKINPSSDKWRHYCKPTIMPYTPWNNKPDYNPWYKTKWIGFIETGIKYANENNIILPKFKYKNVVSTDKKYKKYTTEEIWKAHINCINNCENEKITKLYSNNYFKNNYKNLPNITTLTDKNNEINNKIYSSTYDEFLIRTYKFAKENNINIKTIKYGRKIYD